MDWLAGSKAVDLGIACSQSSAIVAFNLLNSQPIICNNNLPAGTALAFATLFKLGQRSALLAPAARVFPHAVQLLGSRLAATNALARQACRFGGSYRASWAVPLLLCDLFSIAQGI